MYTHTVECMYSNSQAQCVVFVIVAPVPFALIPAAVLREEYYSDECDTKVLV